MAGRQRPSRLGGRGPRPGRGRRHFQTCVFTVGSPSDLISLEVWRKQEHWTFQKVSISSVSSSGKVLLEFGSRYRIRSVREPVGIASIGIVVRNESLNHNAVCFANVRRKPALDARYWLRLEFSGQALTRGVSALRDRHPGKTVEFTRKLTCSRGLREAQFPNLAKSRSGSGHSRKIDCIGHVRT